MNIQFIKSNISNTSQDGLVRLLYDLILQDIKDVRDYKDGLAYVKGDRVYLEENGKHQIYQCIVDVASRVFKRSEWMHVMEVFNGPLDKVYNLKIQEEIHVINDETVNGIVTKLEFDDSKSTITIYNGKKRYVNNYDFYIDGNCINFFNPFNKGDRLILEVREKLGETASLGLIFYDLSGIPYKVTISDSGIVACQKVEIKSPFDQKYAELVTGDCTYTMMVTGFNPPTLGLYKNIDAHITGVDGKTYRLSVVGDTVNMIHDPSATSDVKVIMGTDKKFYKLGLDGDVVTPILIEDETLIPSNFDLGLKVITSDFKHKKIDIRNGQIRILDYTDNTGYNNIVFKSKKDNKIIYMSITEGLELEITDDVYETSGTYTQILDYFYFFDENWDYYRMYFENSVLYYEPYDDSVVPDSRGINILTPNGETAKVYLTDVNGDFSVNKVIKTIKTGTFESPLEGFVVMINDTKKIVTINKECNGFDVKDTDEVFRTNHHYILSENGDVYKLVVEEDSNVQFIKYDVGEADIGNVSKGTFIKSNEVITKFEITDNGVYVFTPISTFVHRIKSDDGKSYILDVEGSQGNENVTFREIGSDEFSTSVSVADLYLQDVNGDYYKVNLTSSGEINFTLEDKIEGVDYDITSLVYSKKGWFRLTLSESKLYLTKVFDNLYENRMSYGNIVKKDYVITSENDIDFTLFANGNGELKIEQIKPLNVNGLVLRSDNGFVYGVGVEDDDLVSYESYITSPRAPRKIYLSDTETGEVYSVFMVGDKLCSELEDNDTPAEDKYPIFDVYQKEYNLIIVNGSLAIQIINNGGILDAIISLSGKTYRVSVIDGDTIDLILDEVTKFNNPGPISIKDPVSGKSYRGYVKDRSIEFIEDTTNEHPVTQMIKTDDGIYVITLEDGSVSFNKNEDEEIPTEKIIEIIDDIIKTTKIRVTGTNVVVSMGGVDDIIYKEKKLEIMDKKDVEEIVDKLK